MPFTREQLHAPGDVLPLPHQFSYWLLPGRVLAGEHPGARGGAAQMAQRLRLLEGIGVGCMIDLTTRADPLPHYLPLAGRRLSFPIGDFGVPTLATMRAALDAIAAALDADEGVYVHCRAGIGRTGTVAGCWLVEQGFAPNEALTLLQQKFRAAAQSHSGRSTPETDAQRAFVASWPQSAACVRSASAAR